MTLQFLTEAILQLGSSNANLCLGVSTTRGAGLKSRSVRKVENCRALRAEGGTLVEQLPTYRIRPQLCFMDENIKEVNYMPRTRQTIDPDR